MESELATIAKAGPDRLIGLAPDGTPRLIWDTATLRIPAHDLPHLEAALNTWCEDEEPPALRRGYYRLMHAPEGGVQLWLRGVGLLLSREDLRVLSALVRTAVVELCAPLCQQPRTPFGLGYRRMSIVRPGRDRQN
jgi:hypothetical protein